MAHGSEKGQLRGGASHKAQVVNNMLILPWYPKNGMMTYDVWILAAYSQVIMANLKYMY